MKAVEIILNFFLGEFTWRKFGVLLIPLCLGIAALVVYELYTSSFRFSRLQKATELVAHLQELQAHATNSTPDLDRVRKLIVAQATQAIEETPLTLSFIPRRLALPVDDLWRFAVAGALWGLFAALQIPKLETKDGKALLIMFLTLAFATGLLGTFIPAIWWPWFHLLIFPYLVLLAIVAVVLPVALGRPALRAAKQKAQSIACVNNLKQIGITARIWAGDHGDILPPDLSSIKNQMKDEITHCPSNNLAQYIIMSGADLTNPSSAFARCPVHNHVLSVDGTVCQEPDANR